MTLKMRWLGFSPVCDSRMGAGTLPGKAAHMLFHFAACLYFYYMGSPTPAPQAACPSVFQASHQSDHWWFLGGWLLSISSCRFFSVIVLRSSWIRVSLYLFQILDTITYLGVHYPHSTEKLVVLPSVVGVPRRGWGFSCSFTNLGAFFL